MKPGCAAAGSQSGVPWFYPRLAACRCFQEGIASSQPAGLAGLFLIVGPHTLGLAAHVPRIARPILHRPQTFKETRKIADRERKALEKAAQAKAAALRDDDNVFDVSYEQQGDGEGTLSATDIKVRQQRSAAPALGGSASEGVAQDPGRREARRTRWCPPLVRCRACPAL